jgi:FKBP-type peptidyl-prolyl cis-trans isomerase SlyD
MLVEKNKVVTIDYTLTSSDGSVLDTSKGEKPLSYIHGTESLVPGLEAELKGKASPAHVSVTVSPAQGYGVRDDSMVFHVPRGQFSEIPDLAVGMQFELQTDEDVHLVTVVAFDDKKFTVDANHPLAGQTLHFEVDVVGVREATAEELEHGHVH